MKAKELDTLSRFLLRTPMWIHPIEQATIVAFIHGFEAGVQHQTFSTTIEKLLETEYEIPASNFGWPRQIQLYAKKREISWNEAFFEIGKLILEQLKQ